MTRSSKSVVREVIETVVIALILALFLRAFVVESFVVDGTSMQPTLRNRERLLVVKFLYRFGRPQIGDIVVFRYPLNPGRVFVKRVIARGGETVEIRQGQVFVNDKPLVEPYLATVRSSSYPFTRVPPGNLFVLGDNRNNSEDSRFFGLVPLGNVKGRALVVYWPIDRVRVVR